MTDLTDQRLPFTLVDELFLYLERADAPLTVQLEAEIPIRLDEGRLSAALTSALEHHPLARASQSPVSGLEQGFEWRVNAAAGIDALTIVECSSEAELSAARRDLYSTPIPLDTAPPLRVWLVHAPGRDVVMLSIHHAAADGIAAMRLLRSVTAAYGGLPEPAPSVDLLHARSLTDRLQPKGISDNVRQLGHQASAALQSLDAPARIAGAGGHGAGGGYRFEQRELDARLLTQMARDVEPTVNDVLLAALHLTIDRWNRAQGADAGRIAVLMPVNLRPAQWRDEVVSNFALFVTVSTRFRDRRHPTACVEAIHRQTRAFKEQQAATWLLPLLRRGRPFPLWLRQLAAPALLGAEERFADTAVLSNLGRVAPLAGLADDIAPQLWFSPPARMPVGVAVGVLTIEASLHLVFRYSTTLLSEEAGSRFADHFKSSLDTLLSTLATVPAQRTGSAIGLNEAR